MDILETATNRYLDEILDLNNIVFEPNGISTAPDFSVNQATAVEVTRLVNIVERDGDSINLTQSGPSLSRSLENTINGVSIPHHKRSFFIELSIRQPINLNVARTELRKILPNIYSGELSLSASYKICEGLTIEAIPTSKAYDSPFRLGGITGADYTGWRGPELLTQTREAMIRKAQSLSRLRPLYKEMWLVVGSQLTLGSVSEYHSELEELLREQAFWDRLILLDILNLKTSTILAR